LRWSTSAGTAVGAGVAIAVGVGVAVGVGSGVGVGVVLTTAGLGEIDIGALGSPPATPPSAHPETAIKKASTAVLTTPVRRFMIMLLLEGRTGESIPELSLAPVPELSLVFCKREGQDEDRARAA